MVTASHCIQWTSGGAGWLKFTPSYDDGAEPFGATPGSFIGRGLTAQTVCRTRKRPSTTRSGHSGGPHWGWWDGETWPRLVGVQSVGAATPGDDTSGNNEAGGGPPLSSLIAYARQSYP